MNSTLGPWTTGDPINEFKDGHVWRVPIWAENGPEGGKIAAEATAPTRVMARANAHLIAAAPDLLALVERAQGIRHPNSGKWTKAETERSWAEWDTQAREALAKAGTPTPADRGTARAIIAHMEAAQ
jgi:hypothetical protein